MCSEPTIFLVDDDAGVRRALSAALESSGLQVSAFASAEDFLAYYKGDEFGCMLLDLRLSGMSGVQLLEKLHDSPNVLPVIMITGHGEVPAAVESMKLGAVDFLQKPLNLEQLITRIQEALQKASASRSTSFSDAKARLASLTPREGEILQMLIGGKSSKQIARDNGLSLRTVNNHRTHLLAKTRAENTADLVRMAVLAGFVGLA